MEKLRRRQPKHTKSDFLLVSIYHTERALDLGRGLFLLGDFLGDFLSV